MQGIIFDVIRRYLEFKGYKVTYVRNYTDIDDKIIKAHEMGDRVSKMTISIVEGCRPLTRACYSLLPPNPVLTHGALCCRSLA